MKGKTIKRVLRRKLDDWFENIKDESVREHMRRQVIVTGGSIVSMLQGQKVNDYDCYLKSREAVLDIAKYYLKQFKEDPPPRFKTGSDILSLESLKLYDDGERVKIIVKSDGVASENDLNGTPYRYFEMFPDGESAEQYLSDVVGDQKDKKELSEDGKDKPKYRPAFLSSNAITLSDDIQIIIRFYGGQEEIHKNFDFIHCTCSYDYATDTLILPNDALEAILIKQLVYNTSKYPICAMIRTRKFMKKGWSINAGQYLKIAWDVSKLNLEDIEVLEDQLTGVDTAYFREVICILKEDHKNGKTIDQTYLAQVIDSIF